MSSWHHAPKSPVPEAVNTEDQVYHLGSFHKRCPPTPRTILPRGHPFMSITIYLLIVNVAQVICTAGTLKKN